MKRPIKPDSKKFGLTPSSLKVLQDNIHSLENRVRFFPDAFKEFSQMVGFSFFLFILFLLLDWPLMIVLIAAMIFIVSGLYEGLSGYSRNRKSLNEIAITGDGKNLIQMEESFRDYNSAVYEYELKLKEWEKNEKEAAEKKRKIEEENRKKIEREKILRLRKEEQFWENLSGIEFEKNVGSLFEDHGYTVSFTPRSNDGGIDIFLEKSSKQIAVQCKRYKSRVSVGHMREFVGAMTAHGVKKGYFMTVKGCTSSAEELAEDNGIKIFSSSDLIKMSKKRTTKKR